MFEPKIIAFLCKWCSSAGADLAGVSRTEYPPNVTPIGLNCSGRVDAQFILEAFKQGADGVLVTGCHTPGDCHYISGNFKTFKKVMLVKKLMGQMGIDPKRLRLEWVSANEGMKFANVSKEFTEQIRGLGPLKYGERTC